MTDEPEKLPWPPEWRRSALRDWTHARSRKSRALVEAVETEIDGRTVPATRFPIRHTPKLHAFVLVLLGVGFLALAIATVVLVVLRGEARLLIGSLVLGGLGALLALGGVAGLVQSRRALGIDLTSQHIIVDLGGDRLVLRWDDIAEFKATSLRYGVGLGPKPVQNWMVATVHDLSAVPALHKRTNSALGRLVARHGGNVAFAVPDSRLAGDPALVYHGLRYFHAFPDLRGQLDDGTAVDTLHSWLSTDPTRRLGEHLDDRAHPG